MEEEAPIIAPLIALMQAVALLLITLAYVVTIAQLFSVIANLLDSVSFPTGIFGTVRPFHFIVTGLNDLNNSVHSLMVGYLKEVEWAWNTLINANAWAWQELSDTVAGVAESAEGALRSLRHAVIPGLLAALIGPLATLVYELRHNIGLLAEHVLHLPHDITKVVEATPKALTVPEVKVPLDIIKAGAVTVPIGYANPWPRVRDLTREVDELWDRASGKVKGLTVGGILGLVAASVFSGLHLGWLRCSNTNRVGRFLCGMDHALLDALLAGLAVWLGTLSLEAFAKDVQGVTVTFEGEVRRFWRANVSGPGHDRALGQTGL